MGLTAMNKNMETNNELNKELKDVVNKIFADLSKEIGNNRQQLANKVLSLHKEINKELTKNEIDAGRKKEILAEVSKIVKMASQQLPHLKWGHPKPVPAKVIAPLVKVEGPTVKRTTPKIKVVALAKPTTKAPAKKKK